MCTLNFVTTLGFSKDCIEISNKIIIRAYDDVKHSSKGIIILLIRVRLAIQSTTFQVLDLELPHNLLLGYPWTHAMKVIPSTYHQCLKFHYNDTKITILSNLDPFQYCSNLKGTFKHQVPINREASPSSTSHYIDPSSLFTSITLSTPIPKGAVQIQYQRNGDYNI